MEYGYGRGTVNKQDFYLLMYSKCFVGVDYWKCHGQKEQTDQYYNKWNPTELWEI